MCLSEIVQLHAQKKHMVFNDAVNPDLPMWTQAWRLPRKDLDTLSENVQKLQLACLDSRSTKKYLPTDLSSRYCCNSFPKSAGCTRADPVNPVIAPQSNGSATQKRGKSWLRCSSGLQNKIHKNGFCRADPKLGCIGQLLCLSSLFLPKQPSLRVLCNRVGPSSVHRVLVEWPTSKDGMIIPSVSTSPWPRFHMFAAWQTGGNIFHQQCFVGVDRQTQFDRNDWSCTFCASCP